MARCDDRLRSRLNALAWVAVMGFVGSAAAELRVDQILAVESEQALLTPLWRGVQGPNDALITATFERELSQLEVSKGVTPAPEMSPTLEPQVIEVPKATWPRSVSIGSPARGWLIYPVGLSTTDRIESRPGRNYGTQEMVDAIVGAVDAVHAKHPGTPPLPVGDLSRKRGGRFPPHLSHQSGRDADIAYYQKGKHHHHKYLKYASRRTIDVARTWTFIESLMADQKVEYLFMDHRLQRVLYKYAKNDLKVSKDRLEEMFAYPRGRRARVGIIRHLRGHADHMHVRFHAPESVAAVKEYVRRHGTQVLKPLPVYTRIKRGDSLWKLARRHRTTVKKLRRWNRIRGRKILRPGKKLVIGWRRPKAP